MHGVITRRACGGARQSASATRKYVPPEPTKITVAAEVATQDGIEMIIRYLAHVEFSRGNLEALEHLRVFLRRNAELVLVPSHGLHVISRDKV